MVLRGYFGGVANNDAWTNALIAARPISPLSVIANHVALNTMPHAASRIQSIPANEKLLVKSGSKKILKKSTGSTFARKSVRQSSIRKLSANDGQSTKLIIPKATLRAGESKRSSVSMDQSAKVFSRNSEPTTSRTGTPKAKRIEMRGARKIGTASRQSTMVTIGNGERFSREQKVRSPRTSGWQSQNGSMVAASIAGRNEN